MMGKIPAAVKDCGKIFIKAGYQCFLVGGAIRDRMMGLETSDFDLATDAQPNEVQRLFRRVIPTGIQHGTVTVLFKGHSFEVTTFRIEGRYSNQRHPRFYRVHPGCAGRSETPRFHRQRHGP